MGPTRSCTARFELATSDIDIGPLREGLLRDEAGAYASFEGWIRNHNDGRPVSGLRYEAYASLAVAEGQRIVEEAAGRFPVSGVHCVHRVGELPVGGLAVWVGASAAHRDAAFDACRYVIDQVKLRVPIWKHESYTDGPAQWLHPDEPGSPPRPA
ncbi:molybdenum cofactor biosynthesis protein MoaE [Pseudoxanthomonas suwonensis]|jgi:Molybdopterin converting factor, large subunit|uniref:molybdenum cofactor biosynthesis protein MoaE n=1 Tax=Pseudoxanthomonas suwonensis TaxID=314722 RepID=UPI00138F6E57|nr:molybdenum cofactor biosynthesis protein MoaE [Pseudoxanthomonas suwonensis]KAF1700052.1 molybdopterin-converting factor chain 2 [Pseudoxanthomonas suwonensis]